MHRHADEVHDGDADGRQGGGINPRISLPALCRQAAKLRTAYRWDNRFSIQAFVASILPFGTFLFDKYLREKEAATT